MPYAVENSMYNFWLPPKCRLSLGIRGVLVPGPTVDAEVPCIKRYNQCTQWALTGQTPSRRSKTEQIFTGKRTKYA